MLLITRKQKAREALILHKCVWHHIYDSPPVPYFNLDRESSEFRARRDRLAALGNSPDPDDVDAIMKNESYKGETYTHTVCAECGQPVGTVVMIGDDDNSSDHCVSWLCKSCIEKALTMFG